MLPLFLGGSLLLHGFVVGAASLFKAPDRVIAPVYNVKLVSAVPSGGTGGGRSTPAPRPVEPAPKTARAEAPKPPPKAAEKPKAEPKKKTAVDPRKAVPAKKEKSKEKSPAKKEPAKPAKPAESAKGSVREPQKKNAGKQAEKTAEQAKGDDFAATLANVGKLIESKAGARGEGAPGAGGDGATKGEIGALAIQIYGGQVQTAIESRWAVPTHLTAFAGTVQVGIRIGADGTVKDAWVDNSSGNRVLDESALRAVWAASPLPAPPTTVRGVFEIYSRFTPKGR